MEFPLNQEESTKCQICKLQCSSQILLSQHQSMVHGHPQNYQRYSYLNQNGYQNEQQQCAKNYVQAQSNPFHGHAQNIKIEGSDTITKVKLESPPHSQINTFSGSKSETNFPSDCQSHPAYSYPHQNGYQSEQQKWTNDYEQGQRHHFHGHAQNIKIEGSDTITKVKLESPPHSQINTFSGSKSETNLPSDCQSHPAYSYPHQNGYQSEKQKWTNDYEQGQRHHFHGHAQNIKIEGSDTSTKIKLENPSYSQTNTFSESKTHTNIINTIQSHSAYSYQSGYQSEQQMANNCVQSQGHPDQNIKVEGSCAKVKLENPSHSETNTFSESKTQTNLANVIQSHVMYDSRNYNPSSITCYDQNIKTEGSGSTTKVKIENSTNSRTNTFLETKFPNVLQSHPAYSYQNGYQNEQQPWGNNYTFPQGHPSDVHSHNFEIEGPDTDTKIKLENQTHSLSQNQIKRPHQPTISDQFKCTKKPKTEKVNRKLNRFNGMSNEEVAANNKLPDYLKPGLDIVFVGINPSLTAAFTGKYYSGPNNHFWKALYLSGLVSDPVGPDDDHKLLDQGIGFTDIVPRATQKAEQLSKQEIIDGGKVLLEKLDKFKPKIIVFNGKKIYQIYSGKKDFYFGKQPEPINNGETWIWVMPSTSGLVAQLPRAVDKVPFFLGLKKLRDFLSGKIDKLEESDRVCSSVVLSNKKTPTKKEETNTSSENQPQINLANDIQKLC
jgi:mismatch-specific thymine-DNA glycosylase